ncbi:MAG: hypothetical protein CMJ65_05415 [Planctomycetaceae bacterium]|nr:hypothetical protein [Planctomycetaceae bacterium]
MSQRLTNREDWQALREVPELVAAILSSDAPALRLQQQLRAKYEPRLVRLALQLVDSRKRASARFERSESMWFDRVGLEQASSEIVSRHKARRFEGLTWDLCCGIGGDALALGERGLVIAVDCDAARAQCCRWNAQTYDVGRNVAVIVADVGKLESFDGLVHIDPDQRAGGAKRSHRIEDSEPGRGYLEELVSKGRGGAIKLSPAANFLGKFMGCEIELISVHRECKQAVIWFGELAGELPAGQANLFRTTVLPDGATLSGHPLGTPFRQEPIGEFLFDPDPSVVRAGLVDVLAEEQGWWRLDDREEYLSGNSPADCPMARCFRVESVTTNRVKAIREAARSAGFGPVEIKCRHVPVDADKLRRKLKLDGDRPGVILVARIGGRTRAVIAERLQQTVA